MSAIAGPSRILPALRFIVPLIGVIVAIGFGMRLPSMGAVNAVIAVASVTIVAVSIRWPILGLLGLVVLTSTVFAYGALPRLGFSGLALYAPEALLLVLIARAALSRPASATAEPSVTYFGFAITGLLLSTVFSVLLAALRGDSVRDSITIGRYMSLYCAYFAARSVLVDRASYRRLIIGLLIIGVPTAVLFDLLVLTSLKDVLARNSLLSIDVFDLYVSTVAQPVQGARIFMPGRALIQFLAPAVLVAAVTLPKGRARLSMVVLSALFGVTIVLIYTRTVWVTTLVMIALLAITGTRRQQASLGRLVTVCVAIIILLMFVLRLASDASGAASLDTIAQRFLTVFTDNVDDPNLQTRILEARQVLDEVSNNLLFGTAFNSPNGVLAWHDGYLSVLLNGGLFSLGFFCLIAVRIVTDWWRTRNAASTDLFVWCFNVGFGLSLVRILLNGFTESTFSDSFTVPLVALGIALVERGRAITLPQKPGLAGRGESAQDAPPVRLRRWLDPSALPSGRST